MAVIAIGLDSAGPDILEELMASGDLPTLKNLKEKSLYGHLDNFDMFTAELPWTTFATGAHPKDTGFWTPIVYTKDYKVHTRAAYEYDEFPAFFALGDDYKVCAFDIPQVRLQKNLNGLQCNAWGAHSPQVKQESNKPEIYSDLLAKYGEHPSLDKDFSTVLDMKRTHKVYDLMMDGIKLRGEVCADLIAREPWDLFITVFGEAHGGGHNLWGFESDHPLYGKDIPEKELLPERPMKNIYKAIDDALKDILAAAPKDASVVIFSPHGMGPNAIDLPSTIFLPELMYRHSFKQPALGNSSEITEPFTTQTWGTWERQVWNTIEKGNPLIKFARKKLPSKIYNILAKYLEFEHEDYPLPYTKALTTFSDVPGQQPVFWYANLWPKMVAFALPSFSEGYVRINLKGREENGIVEAEDYSKTVEEICDSLSQLQCGRTGKPIVRKIFKSRITGFETDPKLPNADIVIAWEEDTVSDVVTHPVHGQIGPFPHYRAGSHRHTGFMMISGSNITTQGEINKGHAMDIGPTILSLMNAPMPNHMKGKCINELSN